MRTTRAVVMTLLLGGFFLASTAQGGDIKGKVSETGLKSAENIAVYIDAIPGKKFDAPAEHVSVDQRDMKFVAQTTVILRGDHRGFSKQRPRRSQRPLVFDQR